MAKIKVISAGVAIGMLMMVVAHLHMRRYQPHLIRKTHLHIEIELSAPPRMGPTSNESAYTALRFAAYVASFSGATMSDIMAVATAKCPAPPIPCNAQRTVL